MKKISYILCMLMASVMFTACSSDDCAENEEVKVYHDENGNYIPITITAALPENPQTRGFSKGNFMDSFWGEDSQIIIFLNGHKSVLNLVSGAQSGLDLQSGATAKFSGRLYYGDVLPVLNESVLRAYIKTYYTQINDDGTYEMLEPTELNYGSAGSSTAAFWEHGVFYAETKYSSSMTFQFAPKTAMLYVPFYGFRNNASDEVYHVTFSGKGLFSPSVTTQIKGDILRSSSGANKDYFACIVDTRYPISDLKIRIDTPEGQYVERNLALKISSSTRLEPGKIYVHEDMNMSPQIGDYLYANDGWGDMLPAEMQKSDDIVGLVYCDNVFTGTTRKSWQRGLAVALKDASDKDEYFTSSFFTSDIEEAIGNSDPASVIGSSIDFDSDDADLIKSHNAPKIASNYKAGIYKWFLPTAGQMNAMAVGLYGATATVSGNDIVYSNFKPNNLKTQIDKLVGIAPFTHPVGDYWTTTFYEQTTGYFTFGTFWYAHFTGTFYDNMMSHQKASQSTGKARIRCVTLAGFRPV